MKKTPREILIELTKGVLGEKEAERIFNKKEDSTPNYNAHIENMIKLVNHIKNY